jgi:hypothetical protein
LDERRARNFVKAHFQTLEPKLIRSFGFLKNACCEDRKIHRSTIIEIFESLIQNVKNNAPSGNIDKQRRPCGMTSENYVDIIIPLIKQIQSSGD